MERAKTPTNASHMPKITTLDLATLDRLIEEAPIGVGMVDRGMRFVRINERLAQMNSLPAATHIGRSAAELFPTHSRIWLPLWQQVIQTGQPIIELELSSDAFDILPNEQRYFLVSYYPIRQAEGFVIGVGVLAQDITERKRAEAGRYLLARMAERLITLDTPGETLAFVVRQVGEHFHANRCVYSEIDMQVGNVQLVETYEPGAPSLANHFTLAECGAFDTYLLAGESIAVANTRSDSRTAAFAAAYEQTQTAAFLCVPRLREDQCIASLAVCSKTPRYWNAHEVTLLRSVADLLWLALERTQLFQEARKSERRYRTLVQATTQGVWNITSNEQEQQSIEWWQDLTGQSTAESADWGWLSALHPDDREAARVVWQEARSAGKNFETCYRIRSHQGLYRTYEVCGIALHTPAGQVEGWIGTFSDITEQQRVKAAERFLANVSAVLVTTMDAEAALRALGQEALGEFADLCATYLVDVDGKSRLVAIACNDPTKAETIDAVSQHYPNDVKAGDAGVASAEAYFVPELTAEHLQHLACNDEHRVLLTQTGAHSLICVPMHARERQIGELRFAMIAPGRRFSDNDFHSAQALASRAAWALDNARLYREAQQALRTRDQFLSLAAHELRTPLTVLLGQTQLALRRATREGSTGEHDIRGLEQIVNQARHLKDMIGDLLDTSRLQEGHLRISQQPVEVVSLVVQFAEETRETLPTHTLQVDTPDTPITISGDTARLTQLLHNLLSNAAKYSPQGSDIHITVQPIDGGVQISVRDQGIGIPAESIPKVCDRFYRAPNVEQAHIEGLGIGLYIVREITTLHGGTLHIESTEGQGSKFVVELPTLGARN